MEYNKYLRKSSEPMFSDEKESASTADMWKSLTGEVTSRPADKVEMKGSRKATRLPNGYTEKGPEDFDEIHNVTLKLTYSKSEKVKELDGYFAVILDVTIAKSEGEVSLIIPRAILWSSPGNREYRELSDEESSKVAQVNRPVIMDVYGSKAKSSGDYRYLRRSAGDAVKNFSDKLNGEERSRLDAWIRVYKKGPDEPSDEGGGGDEFEGMKIIFTDEGSSNAVRQAARLIQKVSRRDPKLKRLGLLAFAELDIPINVIKRLLDGWDGKRKKKKAAGGLEYLRKAESPRDESDPETGVLSVEITLHYPTVSRIFKINKMWDLAPGGPKGNLENKAKRFFEGLIKKFNASIPGRLAIDVENYSASDDTPIPEQPWSSREHDKKSSDTFRFRFVIALGDKSKLQDLKKDLEDFSEENIGDIEFNPESPSSGDSDNEIKLKRAPGSSGEGTPASDVEKQYLENEPSKENVVYNDLDVSWFNRTDDFPLT